MALSVVARLAQRGQRFGAAYVIDLLRGSKAEKIVANGHDTRVGARHRARHRRRGLAVDSAGAGAAGVSWPRRRMVFRC